MTRCLNFRIRASSLKMQVSKRSGRGPTRPILAPINPRVIEHTLTKSLMQEINVSSSGKTIPPKINGIFLRYSPDDIERVPQKESERRQPCSVIASSLVPKRSIGRFWNAAATAKADTSSPKVMVPISNPSIPFSWNNLMVFSASSSFLTSPPSSHLRVRHDNFQTWNICSHIQTALAHFFSPGFIKWFAVRRNKTDFDIFHFNIPFSLLFLVPIQFLCLPLGVKADF